MTTHVIQSASPKTQPEWLRVCLSSVEDWATSNGWKHSLNGDELFEHVPEDIRVKFSAQKPLLADIARLNWARQMFDNDNNLERVIWLDADVLIFAPDKIKIDPAWDFAVGRQIWIQTGAEGTIKTYKQVHNAILVMRRTSPVLDYLRHAVRHIASRHDGPAASQLLGPKLLSALHNIVAFDIVESVGMASPLVIRDITTGGGEALTALRNQTSGEVGAVNLCASYRDKEIDGICLSDAVFAACVDTLRMTKNL